MTTIIEVVQADLEHLADLELKVADNNTRKQAALDLIFTPEIRAKMKAVDEQYAQELGKTNSDIAGLRTKIQGDVLKVGSTVKAKRYMAVWVKGREGSYDTAKLIGYAAAHPELNQFKKPDGKPTVSIRGIKDNE